MDDLRVFYQCNKCHFKMVPYRLVDQNNISYECPICHSIYQLFKQIIVNRDKDRKIIYPPSLDNV